MTTTAPTTAPVPATGPASRRPRRRAAAGLVVLAVLLAVPLAGCGVGGSSDSGTAAPEVSGRSVTDQKGAPAAEGEPSSGGPDGAADASGDRPADLAGPATSARVLPAGRDIVYRGQITVRVRDLARATARAEGLALAAGGVVFSEQSSGDSRRGAPGEARLSLRVPPAEFTETLDSLGALGRALSRTRSAQDVTTELADTDSRLASQERSVARVRGLLEEAKTIGEVVQVESELARREADLESLQAQLARLKDVTGLATVEVTLLARGTPVPPEPDDELGFGSGLREGWDALAGIVLVALTVLGALVPFGVAAVVVGLPAYVLLRSRRRPPTVEA